ncbi:unnamed protein product [Kuraishia capsulata CBS 1993]|uniref:Uncharacterized protein n=1 Tax=Kuraishia capsulata CBS 1993 TaxID=1382522 RepID=W6MTI7_9ASCO|nr:uncharacterized protein KUCA_T00005761001 [Kuraishia capsulata CBS 1993]CDK29768.1 unnamed protein product [Kuraishia capsulata CBS 1993]
MVLLLRYIWQHSLTCSLVPINLANTSFSGKRAAHLPIQAIPKWVQILSCIFQIEIDSHTTQRYRPSTVNFQQWPSKPQSSELPTTSSTRLKREKWANPRRLPTRVLLQYQGHGSVSITFIKLDYLLLTLLKGVLVFLLIGGGVLELLRLFF